MGRSTSVAALALVVCACATAPPPKRVVVKPPPPPPPVRLAVLPVENDAYPKIADAINRVFKTVQVRTAEDYLRPKVTLDVVQLQIECLVSANAMMQSEGRV